MYRNAQEFISSLADVYGAEKSVEFFNKITEVLGEDVRNGIWMSIFSNRIPLSFTAKLDVARFYNAIEVIKSIRAALPGVTLKEAKDISDDIRSGVAKSFNFDSEEEAETLQKRLVEMGCRIY